MTSTCGQRQAKGKGRPRNLAGSVRAVLSSNLRCFEVFLGVEASDACFVSYICFCKQGDFICVKRTDADTGWSMNLAVECYADYFTEDLTALASGKWKLPMLSKVWDQVHQLTLLPGMEMGRCGFEHFLLPSANYKALIDLLSGALLFHPLTLSSE